MKKLLVLVLAMTIASSAFAVVDPDTNSLGFYGDLTADTVEMTATMYSSVNVYLIMTHPDFVTLHGIEYGYEMVGTAMVGNPGFSVPVVDIGTPGNHIVGFSTPIPTSEATVVSTTSFFLMSDTLSLTLTGVVPSSIDNPMQAAVVGPNSSLFGLGDSTGFGNVNFLINATGVVATENVTFDAVKSLYR